MAIDASTTDEVLLIRLSAGDEAAFEALYDRRQPAIYRYALRMCGSEPIAEDVTQDVFMALMRDAAKFDGSKGTVGGYLFGVARHRVLRHLQRGKSFVPMNDALDDDARADAANVDPGADPLEALTRMRTIESVRQAVLSLPIHYREVVVLCSLEEMNYAEAAEALGCPIGTVRSRLHRAREMLVERLDAIRVDGQVPARTPAVRGT